MAKESNFVETVMLLAEGVLPEHYRIRRGAALLYQVTINNLLSVTVDPKNPKRGDSAFQTDLCIFEHKPEGIEVPRVVLEFKTKISTHDVLTYSAKARKHKQVYPYLRYGVVVENAKSVPGRFFVHNEALDFFVALEDLKGSSLKRMLSELMQAELKSSTQLEQIAFGKQHARLYRSEVLLA